MSTCGYERWLFHAGVVALSSALVSSCRNMPSASVRSVTAGTSGPVSQQVASITAAVGTDPNEITADRQYPRAEVPQDHEFLKFGNISVHFGNGRLTVKGPAGVSQYQNDIGSLKYAYILRTHRAKLNGSDGVVVPGVDVLPIPTDRLLSPKDLPRFSFFSAKPTTIGFLLGSAGASGGSTQQMILLDTVTGMQAVIHLDDMWPPVWLDDRFPPSYAETTTSIALGGHATSLGRSPRIGRAYVFRDGRYVRDSEAESRIYQQKCRNVRLTADDLAELRRHDLTKINRASGTRFLDYLYYGTLSGHTNSVQALLKGVSDTVREEALWILPYVAGPAHR